MNHSCRLKEEPEIDKTALAGQPLFASTTGIYQGFDKEELLSLCKKEDLMIRFHYGTGTFLVEGTPYAIISKTFFRRSKR